jgi:PIN domain nuclease of toxin-antitoxin system
MSYLLDTHTFLWFINDDETLSAYAKALIENTDNLIFLSIATLWEMAIKVSLGKLKVPMPFAAFMDTQLRDNDMKVLSISIEQLDLVASLPFHHRDPFDRLIIAQSLNERLPIIGRDTLFDVYGVKRYW